jgi:hypothetical protein
LEIEHPFSIAQVLFSYFTADDIEWMVRQCIDIPKEAETLMREKYSRKLQGRVYAESRWIAEPIRARELAEFHTERALEVLRFYHPSALEVRAPCWLGVLGRVSPGQTTTLYRADVMKDLSIVTESTVAVGVRRFGITVALLEQMGKAGLGLVAKMIANRDRTELEEAVLNAVAIFSWGLGSNSARDRLLHALFSVESLLLASDSEPITSNIGYRMAFLIRSDAPARKALIADISKAYRLRGKFVHHGIDPTDIELMNRAIRACWLTVIEAIVRTSRFRTRKDLIDGLQDQILS